METLNEALWANKRVVMVSLFHVDRRTDMMRLTVALHSCFASAQTAYNEGTDNTDWAGLNRLRIQVSGGLRQ